MSSLIRYYQCPKCGKTLPVNINTNKAFATPKCNQCRDNMVLVGYGEKNDNED